MRWSGSLLLCLLMVGSGQAAAEENWRLRGDTTLRVDKYEERGNPGLSRFPHHGSHSFQDFNLKLSGQPREQEFWEFNVSGVISESDYRTREQGFTPEWLHMRHENRHTRIPFRVDLGDQHTHFSRLTLDRRIQAARLELQPVSSGERRHSVVWVSGRDKTDWRNPTGFEDTYHGASWLIEDTKLGRYSFNLVQTTAGDEKQIPPTLEDTQLVASLAADWELAVFRQQIKAEAELAWLDGQAVVNGPDSDEGMRMLVTGRDQELPLNYAFRYERYDRGFRPAGVNPGFVHGIADSRSMGASGGWRFGSGLEIHSGYDRYVHHASSWPLTVNNRHVRLLAPGTFGWLSWADQEWTVRLSDRENSLDTVDTGSTELRWNIRLSGREGTSTHLQFRWFELENHIHEAFAFEERQLLLNHSRRFQIGPVNLTATPGVDIRERTGAGESTIAYPTLALNASSHEHHLGLRLGFREFLRPEGIDLEEYSLKLDYRYHARSHTFGVEYDRLLREPETGEDLESWRTSAYWRYNFNHAF